MVRLLFQTFDGHLWSAILPFATYVVALAIRRGYSRGNGTIQIHWGARARHKWRRLRSRLTWCFLPWGWTDSPTTGGRPQRSRL